MAVLLLERSMALLFVYPAIWLLTINFSPLIISAHANKAIFIKTHKKNVQPVVVMDLWLNNNVMMGIK